MAAVGGLLSERVEFGWRDLAVWLPDFLVGMALLGSGLWAARRNRGTGLLLIATGGAWFAANAWPDARFVHRALIVHAIVAFAGWRPRSRADVAAVIVGYVAAVWPIGWGGGGGGRGPGGGLPRVVWCPWGGCP